MESLMFLLLAVWVGAVVTLVYVDRAAKFLWIPSFLVVAGLFSSVLPVALSSNVALVTNGTILILFIASLEVLKKKRHPAIASLRSRVR